MMISTLLAVLALGGAAALWASRRRAAEEETTLLHRCRMCRQQVRSPAPLAGRVVLCPRCDMPLLLPAAGPKKVRADKAPRLKIRVARLAPADQPRRAG